MARGNPLVTPSIFDEESNISLGSLYKNTKNKIVDQATKRKEIDAYMNERGRYFSDAGVYVPEFGEDQYGAGVGSSARHQAAAASTSDYLANLLDYTPFRPISGFMGDVGSFGAGALQEVKGSLFDYGKSIADGNIDNNYLGAFAQDMKDNFVGSFLTPRYTGYMDVVDKVYKRPTAIAEAMIANGPTAKQINDSLAMDSQLMQQTVGDFSKPTAVTPTTPPPPPTPTQRNVTKFSPTRSTAIKGGRGGRGNVGGNSMKAGSSRNYGVTGRRVVGGR